MTKAKREEQQKAWLRQRVSDVCRGAAGFDIDHPDEWTTCEHLSRIVPALEVIFGIENNKHLWKTHNLHYYNDVDSITDFLWENEVRP